MLGSFCRYAHLFHFQLRWSPSKPMAFPTQSARLCLVATLSLFIFNCDGRLQSLRLFRLNRLGSV